jgi:hypothetical protein
LPCLDPLSIKVSVFRQDLFHHLGRAHPLREQRQSARSIMWIRFELRSHRSHSRLCIGHARAVDTWLPLSPSGTTCIPKRFPMRGFDWFDTDVECAERSKIQTQNHRQKRGRPAFSKNQIRKGRPRGKRRESKSFYRAEVPLAANPTK